MFEIGSGDAVSGMMQAAGFQSVSVKRILQDLTAWCPACMISAKVFKIRKKRSIDDREKRNKRLCLTDWKIY